MSLTIGTGCWSCDGPTLALVRIYLDPSGASREEILLDPAQIDLPPGAAQSFNGVYSDSDGAHIAVSICIKNPCGTGSLDLWSADSESAIFTSDDGGVTWKELGRAGPVGWLVGLANGQAVANVFNENTHEDRWVLVPSGTQIVRPIGATSPLTADGQILWRTLDGRLLTEDGTEFLRLPSALDEPFIDSIVGPVGSLAEGQLLVSWWSNPHEGASTFHLTVYDHGEGGLEVVRDLTSDQVIFPGYWTQAGSFALATVDTFGLPIPRSGIDPKHPSVMHVDLATGGMRYIIGFSLGRNLILNVQIGPFARVVNTGSCLNVRAGTSSISESLDCAADGVLLRNNGETITVDGLEWLSVTTPAGIQGWASAEFIER